jgi:hypothetical protein
MRQDVFGSFTDWGHVLERLAELARSGELEQHQDALLTMLRYDMNWRLREAALESIKTLRHPSPALMRQVWRIVANPGLYFQVRVLAAEAFGVCLDHLQDVREEPAVQLRRDARKQLHELLDVQDVPVLHQAVRRILPRIE